MFFSLLHTRYSLLFLSTPEIIYTDDEIIVVNKPAGLTVHGGPGIREPTLADFLLERFPDIAGIGDDPARPGLVHRLDRDTSGVMVVARNPAAFGWLKKEFADRRVRKTYLAFCCGVFKDKKGAVDLAIGRNARNPRLRGVGLAGARIRGERPARTEFRVLKDADGLSFVELHPLTGRMHQLRVHMKAIGHAVACDRLYGGQNVCCPSGAGRQLLHAAGLSFSMEGGRGFRFEAELPADMADVLKTFFPADV
ncbi:MAG: RluA family pseudouridine synthase [Patescibacteria group bacterium]